MTFIALIIIFAFLVVAKLVDAHFVSERAYTSKRRELGIDNDAKRPASAAQQSSGISGWTTAIIICSSVFFLLCIITGILIISVSPTEVHEAKVRMPSATSSTEIGSALSAEQVESTYQDPLPLEHIERKILDPAQQHQRIEQWKADLPFPANQYSGVESCAIPLARLIHKELESVRNNRQPKSETVAEDESGEKVDKKNTELPASQILVVNVEQLKANGHAAFFDQFKLAFERLSPTVKIVDSKLANRQEKNDVSGEKSTAEYKVTFNVRFGSSGTDAFPYRSLELENGDLQCELQVKGSDEEIRKKNFSVDFNDIPWLNNFENFARLDPSQKIYVGLSKSFEQSADTAHQIAVQDVADQLGLSSLNIDATVYRRIFKQKITRPYGKVYREAILIIDTGNNFGVQKIFAGPPGSSVSSGKPLEINAERGIAVLAILTVVLTFVANIATQGYYRRRLSQTTVIVCSLAAIFIFLIVILNFA